MPRKRPRRTLSTREQLRLARGQLAAVTRTLQRLPKATNAQPSGQPSRFVQCWAVHRGFSSFTHALDETGQVWECKVNLETINGVKRMVDNWWEPLSMRRVVEHKR